MRARARYATTAMSCGTALMLGMGVYAALPAIGAPAPLPACTITGTQRPDRLVGTGGNDVIRGLGGGDTILAEGGDDVVVGGDGDDFIVAGKGKDMVYAGEGDDIVLGGEGNDNLRGGNGKDIISGADGNDVLDGGNGKDKVKQGLVGAVLDNDVKVFVRWDFIADNQAERQATGGVKVVYTGEGSCTSDEATLTFAPDVGAGSNSYWWRAKGDAFLVRSGTFRECGHERASAHFILYDKNNNDVGDVWFVAKDAGGTSMEIRSHSGFEIIDFRRDDNWVTIYGRKTSNK